MEGHQLLGGAWRVAGGDVGALERVGSEVKRRLQVFLCPAPDHRMVGSYPWCLLDRLVGPGVSVYFGV